MTVGMARYWDGRAWTEHVAWGGTAWRDATPLADVERRELEQRAAVVADYLDDVSARRLVHPDVIDVLRTDARRGAAEAPPSPRPTRTGAGSRPAPPAVDAERDASTVSGSWPAPSAPRRAPVRPIPREPGRVAAWWTRAKRDVRGDLALHGLAYLGVLLLFAGVSGLFVFSLGDVSPWLRTLAEALVPTALFLAAWYLHRHAATMVAGALTVLGGAISPIVVAASLTDGAPVPPDATGHALPVAQGAAVALVGVAMLLVVRRWPSNPLRFVVAPVLWTAIGLAAAALRDPVPSGYDTARPDALQIAIVLVAIAATVIATTGRRSPLAAATTTVALPAAAVVALLEVVVAGSEGWPPASSVLTGVAIAVVAECYAGRLTPRWTSLAQIAAVAVTAMRLAAVAAPAWVAAGTVVVSLLLVEHLGRRRPTTLGAIGGLAVAGLAASFTLDEAWATALAFGVITLWGLWRHVDVPPWMPRPDRFGIVPGVGAAVVATAIWALAGEGPTVTGSAAVVLGVAVSGRMWSGVGRDAMWRWWVPAAAWTTVAATASLPWGDMPLVVAVATAICAGAVLMTQMATWARAWMVAAMTVWLAANVAEALQLDRSIQALLLAFASLGAIAVALAVRRGVSVPLAMIGHVGGVGALVVATWPGWAATVALASATLGWVACTVVDERTGAPHLRVIDGALRDPQRSADADQAVGEDGPSAVGALAPLLAFAGSVATVLSLFDTTGWISVDDPWAAALVGAVALVAAVVVRLGRWQRVRPDVLVWAVVAVAVGAALVAIETVGADRGHWAPVATLATLLGVVLVTASPRPAPLIWLAWADALALPVVLVDRFGLDRSWLDDVAAAGGAAVMLGGLATARLRHRPIRPTELGRAPASAAPTLLGAAVFVIGATSGLSEGSDVAIGWTAVGVAAAILAAAILLPLPALAAVAEAVATVAYVLLVPWEPLDRPWSLGPWALLLLVAAVPFRDRPGPRWSRWDLPSFAVAHGVAALALLAAVDTAALAPTAATFAALAFGVTAVLRRWPWAVAGAALLLVSAIDLGSGWLGLVLVLEGAAVTAIGLRQVGALRWGLLGLGALAIVAAWYDLGVWRSWSSTTVLVITMPGGAVVALLAALGARHLRVPQELATVWTIAGATAAISAVPFLETVGNRPGGWVAAASMLVLAGAAAVTATDLGTSMRWSAASLTSGAWIPLIWAIQPTSAGITLVGTSVALAVLVAATAVHGRRPTAVWLMPVAGFAAATQLGALAVAAAHPTDVEPLVIALLAVAAELVAAGVLTARHETFVAAPIAACAAWLVYAADALTGSVNWFTAPVGLTLLVMTGLLRWIRRGRGGDVAGADVVISELVGMSFLVGPPLVRTLTGHLWEGVLTAGVGVVLATWGLVTRVRWRAEFGVAATVVAVVVVIAVPLSGAITWSGAALWLTLSIVGAVAIALASSIEGNRERIRRLNGRLGELTAEWERWTVGGGRHRRGNGGHA